MTLLKDQELIAKFYETIGKKLNGHLIDIKEGPLVYNFIIKQHGVTPHLSSIKKLAQEYNYFITIGSDNNIVVQIPKQEKQTVKLEDLMTTPEYKNTKAVLPIILGVDTLGNPIITDLEKFPHLLITGRTGCGKTILEKSLLKSLISKLTPSECKIVIMDAKAVDFCGDTWNKDNHLLMPNIFDTDSGHNAFNSILQIIEDRYQILKANNVRNALEYRTKTNKQDMPFIVIVIDELADFMITNKKLTENFITTICTKARAAGIHLIVTTQRSHTDTLSNVIKDFLPVHITYQTNSSKDSKLMFGETGAENLLSCGDMLFREAGKPTIRVHSPSVED